MSKYLPDFLKLGRKPVDMSVDYTKAYKIKVKFSMLGPVLCGKSSIAAGFLVTCETMSSIIPNFYCRVLPTSSHILADANNLRLGQFPVKTDPTTPRAPEAGFLLCERGFREKKTQVPISDVAGEISDHINFKASQAAHVPAQIIRQRLQAVNSAVVEAVKDSQGLIVALAADEALMFRKHASSFDADVYLHNVMNHILEYRRQMHRGDPHIIVVLTKWDEVIQKAQDIDMDVFDESQNNMAKFLANGFPGVNMLLKPLVDKGNVKFFRSYFKVKRHDDGAPVYWEDAEGRPTKQKVIEIIEDKTGPIRFRPAYAEDEYIKMVKHIGSFGQ
jgi:hypothetical protein